MTADYRSTNERVIQNAVVQHCNFEPDRPNVWQNFIFRVRAQWRLGELSGLTHQYRHRVALQSMGVISKPECRGISSDIHRGLYSYSYAAVPVDDSETTENKRRTSHSASQSNAASCWTQCAEVGPYTARASRGVRKRRRDARRESS
jgi:hypothetical protein